MGNIYSNVNIVGTYTQGSGSTASGTSSHAEGVSTIAGGSASHAEGIATTASGDYSHAEGVGTIAIGISSHAGGRLSETTRYSEFARASGSFTTVGDAQHSIVTARAEGIGTVDLFLDGVGASERITIPYNSVVGFVASTVIYDATANESMMAITTGIIKNITGTTSFEGTPTTGTNGSAGLTSNFINAIIADDTNDSLNLSYGFGAPYNTDSMKYVSKVELVQTKF